MNFGFDDDNRHDGEHEHRHHHHQAARFLQTNLVSDGSAQAGPAPTIDPNLVNPWGVSHAPGGPFWVSDNGTGVTTVYTGGGTVVPIGGHPSITVAPPPGQMGPSAPTGQVFNTTGQGFDITAN